MVVSGDWIIPEYNGYPRHQKPILFYWLQAIAQAQLGSTPWAARLPSAMAGTLLVLLMASVGKALWGSRAGLWSGIALGLSVEIVLLSRMVMTDVVLLLFVQSGLAAFYRAQLSEPTGRGKWYLLMHAALALGVLTKGPIALVLPTAMLVPWLLVRGELLTTIRELRLGWGLMLLLVIAGPWYFLADTFSQGEFTWHFFITENLGRFTSNVNPHDAPSLLYFLILVPLTFPWAGMMPQVLASVRKSPLRNAPFRDAAPWLFAWQIALVLFVFTLSSTRVWTYTLPILPPLALLVGRWLATHLGEAGLSRSPLRWALWAFVVIAGSLAAAAWSLHQEHLPSEVRTDSILACLRLLTSFLFVLSLLVLLLDHVTPLRITLLTLVGGVAAFYLTVACIGAPMADRLLKGPVREAAATIRAERGEFVITYMVHELSLNHYTGLRSISHCREESLGQIAVMLNSDYRVFLLVSPEHERELEGLNFHVWSRHTRFVLGANYPPEPGFATVVHGPGDVGRGTISVGQQSNPW